MERSLFCIKEDGSEGLCCVIPPPPLDAEEGDDDAIEIPTTGATTGNTNQAQNPQHP